MAMPSYGSQPQTHPHFRKFGQSLLKFGIVAMPAKVMVGPTVPSGKGDRDRTGSKQLSGPCVGRPN